MKAPEAGILFFASLSTSRVGTLRFVYPTLRTSLARWRKLAPCGWRANCVRSDAKKGLDKHNYITKNIVMNVDYTKAIPDVWKNVSRVFSALGDEHRQRILLTFEPRERLNVGQIVEVSTLSRSAVSHHLRILREAGVLDSEKIGKEVYFWLNKRQIKASLVAVIDYLKTQ